MIDDLQGTGFSGAAASTTLTGFFDSRLEADTAADRLRDLGLSGRVDVTAGESGSAGSVTGSPAGTGSETGEPQGFFDALAAFFFPDDDRSTFAEGLARGGYLVTVTGLSPDDYDRAMDVLEDAGAVDIDERAESWRAEGWTGAYAGQGDLAADLPGGLAAGSSAVGMSGGMASASGSSAHRSGDRDDETVPVVEERLRVGKRDTSHGRVRVRSYVVEEPVTESVTLAEERVEVDRRRVDRPVSGATEDLFRDRSIEAEEFRQEAVVSKEARVVEEVGLRRSHDSREETISDTVRHTEVEVEDDRSGSGSLRGSQDRVTEEEAELDEDDDDLSDRRPTSGL